MRASHAHKKVLSHESNIAQIKELSFRAGSNRRGNLPDFQSFLVYLGDCHTSDIGHWFAMTAFLFILP